MPITQFQVTSATASKYSAQPKLTGKNNQLQFHFCDIQRKCITHTDGFFFHIFVSSQNSISLRNDATGPNSCSVKAKKNYGSYKNHGLTQKTLFDRCLVFVGLIAHQEIVIRPAFLFLRILRGKCLMIAFKRLFLVICRILYEWIVVRSGSLWDAVVQFNRGTRLQNSRY